MPDILSAFEVNVAAPHVPNWPERRRARLSREEAIGREGGLVEAMTETGVECSPAILAAGWVSAKNTRGYP